MRFRFTVVSCILPRQRRNAAETFNFGRLDLTLNSCKFCDMHTFYMGYHIYFKRSRKSKSILGRIGSFDQYKIDMFSSQLSIYTKAVQKVYLGK